MWAEFDLEFDDSEVQNSNSLELSGGENLQEEKGGEDHEKACVDDQIETLGESRAGPAAKPAKRSKFQTTSLITSSVVKPPPPDEVAGQEGQGREKLISLELPSFAVPGQEGLFAAVRPETKAALVNPFAALSAQSAPRSQKAAASLPVPRPPTPPRRRQNQEGPPQTKRSPPTPVFSSALGGLVDYNSDDSESQ